MATKGIVINISGSGEGAAEALRQIEAKMQETAVKGKEAGDRLKESMRGFQESITLIRDTFVLDRAFEAIKGMIEKSVDLGMELGHLSQQTGISTENLSVLRFAALETGVEFDTLTKGFKKLSTTVFELHEGSKLATDSFAALGLSQKQVDAAGNDMYKVMALVADKFKDMPDGLNKNAITTQLFGKAGQSLIPILNQGSAAIAGFRSEAEKYGVVLDSAAIERTEKLHKAFVDLSESATGAGLSITSHLAPALEWLAQEIPEIIGVGGGKHGNDFAGGLDAINEWADGFVHAIGRVSMAAMMMPLGGGGAEYFDKMFPGDRSQYQGFLSGSTGTKSMLDAMKEVKGLGNGGKGFGPPDDKNSVGVEMSTLRQIDAEAKREEEALTRLIAAGENARLQVIKSGSSLRLAQLEAEHKEGLVTEEAYLKQKLGLDEAAIDAEIAAEQDKRRDLQKGIQSASGGSPEQFDLQAKLVQVETKLTELANARQAAEAQITAELQNQAWAKQVRAASEEIQERRRKEEEQDKIASLRQQGKQKGEDLNSQITNQAAGTITGFVDQLSESAIRGKISFKSLADSAIADLERFAMKVLEERALLPLLNSLFGIGAQGSGATNLANILSKGASNYAGMNGSAFQGDLPGLFANGGDINSGWAVVGDGGDGSGSELFAPKGPGTILPHDVLQGLANAKSGGGGGSPSVTINNINNSSSQVQMKQGGVSYDAQARQFVIHTVLEDMNQGGPLSSAMSGFAPK
jgi:DNA-binding Xre family transcriptional regulator